MNREIKFRAWDKISSVMKLPKQIHFEHKEVIFETDNELIASDWRSFDNTILMQFTGINDKNGIDICEGDIVEYSGANTHYKTKTGIVKWLNNRCGFYIVYKGVGTDIINRNPFESVFKIGAYKWNIIGNIYENPELC